MLTSTEDQGQLAAAVSELNTCQGSVVGHTFQPTNALFFSTDGEVGILLNDMAPDASAACAMLADNATKAGASALVLALIPAAVSPPRIVGPGTYRKGPPFLLGARSASGQFSRWDSQCQEVVSAVEGFATTGEITVSTVNLSPTTGRIAGQYTFTIGPQQDHVVGQFLATPCAALSALMALKSPPILTCTP